ncbi:hypothetical protein SO694_00022127 [Aureococcus anophagefferens]|uniref:Uncharacterized protein n=1 Tax=Aureococcus anophagefferens TaxID=44056 RepID=A0ABR1FT84_AURAN
MSMHQEQMLGQGVAPMEQMVAPAGATPRLSPRDPAIPPAPRRLRRRRRAARARQRRAAADAAADVAAAAPVDDEPVVLDDEPVVIDDEPVVLDDEPVVLDDEPVVLADAAAPPPAVALDASPASEPDARTLRRRAAGPAAAGERRAKDSDLQSTAKTLASPASDASEPAAARFDEPAEPAASDEPPPEEAAEPVEEETAHVLFDEPPAAVAATPRGGPRRTRRRPARSTTRTCRAGGALARDARRCRARGPRELRLAAARDPEAAAEEATMAAGENPEEDAAMMAAIGVDPEDRAALIAAANAEIGRGEPEARDEPEEPAAALRWDDAAEPPGGAALGRGARGAPLRHDLGDDAGAPGPGFESGKKKKKRKARKSPRFPDDAMATRPAGQSQTPGNPGPGRGAHRPGPVLRRARGRRGGREAQGREPREARAQEEAEAKSRRGAPVRPRGSRPSSDAAEKRGDDSASPAKRRSRGSSPRSAVDVEQSASDLSGDGRTAARAGGVGRRRRRDGFLLAFLVASGVDAPRAVRAAARLRDANCGDLALHAAGLRSHEIRQLLRSAKLARSALRSSPRKRLPKIRDKNLRSKSAQDQATSSAYGGRGVKPSIDPTSWAKKRKEQVLSAERRRKIRQTE